MNSELNVERFLGSIQTYVSNRAHYRVQSEQNIEQISKSKWANNNGPTPHLNRKSMKTGAGGHQLNHQHGNVKYRHN